MSADGGPPDVCKIAEHSRAIFRAGLVTGDVALDGLRQIRESLRREFNACDKELAPITELIAEFEASQAGELRGQSVAGLDPVGEGGHDEPQ
jgi:hypothetical protein